MTEQEKFIHQCAKVFVETLGTLQSRCEKYAEPTDPFLNFRNSAVIAGVDLKIGILTRIGDKLGRIKKCLWDATENRFNDESLEDSIQDAIGYLCILLVAVRSQDGEDLGIDLGITEDPVPDLGGIEKESDSWFTRWARG